MTIRNDNLGGTSITDGYIYTVADFNDTFDATQTLFNRNALRTTANTFNAGTTTINGSVTSTYDSDMTSYYELITTGNNTSVGLIYHVATFPKVYFDCQVSYHVYFKFQASSGTKTNEVRIEHSVDNSTWYILTSDTMTTSASFLETTMTDSKALIAARYLRVYVANSAIGDGENTTSTARIYELRLRGHD
jgi:hypothetical protein